MGPYGTLILPSGKDVTTSRNSELTHEAVGFTGIEWDQMVVRRWEYECNGDGMGIMQETLTAITHYGFRMVYSTHGDFGVGLSLGSAH